jgi:aminoglycoside phosphotransferase (APT) family kinase protein
MNTTSLLQAITSNFSLPSSQPLQIKPLGEGLIHQTFLIEGQPKSWVLQGFNSNVFKFPERIASNLKLLSRLSELQPLPFILPLPLANKKGETLTELEGLFYRLFEFVQGHTIQKITDANQAYLAARAYGQFADWGKVIEAEALQETIPNFHRLDLRFSRFLEVLSAKESLSQEEKDVADFYASQSKLVEDYTSIAQSIPFRLTHNDTKINNLIFSEDLDKVEAVIDLDTLMAGMLLYDFGDLVRTVACSEPETSQNWGNLFLIPEVFEVLLKGFWEGIKDFATPEEIRSLLLGGEVMTIIMGLRFFTDHLEGNVYYRVEYPEQNFHRAKNQMIFLQSQQSLLPKLQQIWEKVTGSKI